MKFREYDKLRLFTFVANELNFTKSAEKLFMTKGAVSYQIKQLEYELGFDLFVRSRRGLTLTEDGIKVWHLAQSSFDYFEEGISAIRYNKSQAVIIGVTTYFAARWLSLRLTSFIQQYPDISLYIQPVIDIINVDNNIDMTIRWGNGNWSDMEIEHLFYSPAFPCAGAEINEQIKVKGLEEALRTVTLLHDGNTSLAWEDWFKRMQFEWQPRLNQLSIPDPTVRVQAVINGQGIAFNDALIAQELNENKIFRIPSISLHDYGYYLAYQPRNLENPSVRIFRDWMLSIEKPR